MAGIPGIPGPPIHKCHNCGKRITRKETAALVDSKGHAWRWCFDCWDQDPKAVEQYQTVGYKRD